MQEMYFKCYNAIRNNDAVKLEELLIEMINSVNISNVDLIVLFHKAKQNGNTTILNILVNTVPMEPLLYHVCKMDERKTMELFIELNDSLKYRLIDEQPLMHICAEFNSTHVCKFLIGQGINVNGRNEFKETPLHIACEYSNLRFVKLLCKSYRIDMTATDCYHRNAFITACDNNKNLEIIKYLLSTSVNPNCKDLAGNSGFAVVCRQHHHDDDDMVAAAATDTIIEYILSVKHLLDIKIDENNLNIQKYMLEKPHLFVVAETQAEADAEVELTMATSALNHSDIDTL